MYPGIARRLFASGGAGPRLRPDILPEEPVPLVPDAATGALALDGDLGRVFCATIAAPVTVTAAAPPGACLLLLLKNGGAHAVTWGMTPRWPFGAPPALSADGDDLVALLRGPDAWYGVHVAANCPGEA